jgi:hypothetical protein
LLLQHGAEVNRIGIRGHTPLWGACKDDHLDTVKLLMDNGADPNVHKLQSTVRIQSLLRPQY